MLKEEQELRRFGADYIMPGERQARFMSLITALRRSVYEDAAKVVEAQNELSSLFDLAAAIRERGRK